MKKTSPEPREEDKIPPPVPAEPEDSSADGEATDDPVASLQGDLDRFRDLALRTQADFENYKKRAARERDEGIKYANRSLLERLVPIVDNFELGLSAAREGGELSPFYSGMGMVLKQFPDFLADAGLEPIDAVEKKFDPTLHEEIGHEPSNKVPEGGVIRKTRRGYRLKDRLLRPAAVVVSSGAARSSNE